MVSETERSGGRPARAEAAAAAALLSLTLGLSAPAAIYFGNRTEFIDAFVEIAPWLIGATLVSTCVLTACLVVLGPALRTAAVTGVTVLALALWTQSHLIVQRPAILSGVPVDWSQYAWQGWADRALWCGALATAVGCIIAGWRWRGSVVVALCAVQAGAVMLQAVVSPPRWVDRTLFDERQRYALSSRQNVMVLVLDTFQSDLFQDLLDHDPAMGEALQGFTYFRNATGGYPSTAPSIPFILTGRQYDNSQPFDEFVRHAFVDGSLPQVLKAAGHHVYYNSAYLWPAMFADETTSSHASTPPAAFELAPWARASMLLALGAFRSAPQDVKRLIEEPVIELATRGAVPWGDDRTFFDEFDRDARASLDVPVFKYYHLQGLHPPLRYDGALRSSHRPFTRANALDQARGLVSLLRRLVRTLDSRGDYDRTALFVLADHGAALEPRLVDIDPKARTVPDATAVPTAHSFGLPLLLAKPFDRRGVLVTSDAPVSIGDLGATVGQLLALGDAWPGVSIFEQSVVSRPRTVLRYDPDRLDLDRNHLPPTTEFTVAGFSWLGESWRPTGRVLTALGPRRRSAQVARAAEPLTFGTSGNAALVQEDGWSLPEDGFTWTNGWMARLDLMVPSCPGEVELHAQVLPALLGGRAHQPVEVLDGDRVAGRWQVASAGTFLVSLPSGPEARLASIRFVMPEAVVPAEVDPSLGDTRRLGLAFSSIQARCQTR
jgi:hypothetical protein